MKDVPVLDESALETLLGQVADEYTEALQRGAQPDIEAYVQRYPQLATVLRQVLPALQVMRPTAAPTPELPARLGDYRIVREIGRGGMGIVYEAERISQPSLAGEESRGRRVALKVLPVSPAQDAKQLARFQREAKTAALLHHTNIVPVFDVGSAQGVHYYAMQLIEGHGLDYYLQAMRSRLASTVVHTPKTQAVVRVQDAQAGEFAGPLVSPSSRAPAGSRPHFSAASRSGEGSSYFLAVARMGMQVAEALEYAHQRGVIHRDIKPSNLILDARGLVWISDFGLVKCVEGSDANLTRTGDVIGTARYMSPEQALAKKVPLDARSDIYSLGVTLYELLTLHPAFDGADHEAVLKQIAFEEPTAPRQRNWAIPRDLETIVVKAMARASKDRYASAAALAAELRRFVAGEPIQARPLGVWERSWRWAKRRPAVAALLGVIVLATVSLLAGGWWSNAQLRRAAEQLRLAAEGERQAAEREREAAGRERLRAREAEQRELIARRHSYAARLHLAQQAWERGHVARMRTLLDDLKPTPPQEDLRGFEWFYLWRLCHRDRRTLLGHEHFVSAVAFAPDGKTLASASQDRTIKLWDLATGKTRATLHGHMEWVTSVVFSPDGTQLASGGYDRTIRLWDVASSQERAVLRGVPSEIDAVSFSPDGQIVAAGGRDGSVVLWFPARGLEQVVFQAHSARVACLAFAPDGATLATGSADRTVRLWSLDTRQPLVTLRGHTDVVRALAFAPGSKMLATGSADRSVRLWNLTTGKELASFQGHSEAVGAVAFSPDGKVLASASGDPSNPLRPAELLYPQNSIRSKPGEVKLWNVQTGQEQVTLKGHRGPIHCLAYSPDGQTIATGSDDMTVMVWDVTGPEQSSFQGHEREVNSVAFSPDGRLLVSVSDDQAVKVWDLVTGRERATLKHRSNVKFVVFAPDGKTFATGGGAQTVVLWDTGTLRELATFKGHTLTVRSIVFSPDGQTLVTGAGDLSAAKPKPGEIKLWDLATRKEKASLKGHTEAVRSVDVTRDGRLLASGGDDGTVKIWDMATTREIITLPGHTEWVRYVAFSPDGRTLASASSDATVKLWDVETWKERIVVRGHRAGVLIVVYAPDGKTLATGSTDGTVKFWDAVTGEERAVLEGHKGSIRAVAFAPDGRTLATGDNHTLVKLWYAVRER